jgi:hypothetical protein
VLLWFRREGIAYRGEARTNLDGHHLGVNRESQVRPLVQPRRQLLEHLLLDGRVEVPGQAS